jgi:aminobenzoyl-glutamate transport protein
MKEKTVEKKPLLARFMDGVETVCNMLPPPTMLFVFLFFIVAILGAVFTFLGTSLTNPATGEIVMSKNFFSKEGLLWFLDNMVKNFTGFAPLGLVLTMTIGTGICEEAGMLNSLLRSSMKNVPAALVPYVCVLIGIIGNLASDAASVMVPPLAAMAFMGVGKHPVAGMICGYIGAQVGYAANPVISGTDTLLMGITNDTLASFMGDSAFTVDVTCNWFFKIASTVLCVVVIGILVQKIVEPRFGVYHGELEKMEDLTPSEKKGLRASGISTLIYVACLLALFFTGVIAAEDGGLIGSPFLKGLIPIIFLMFVIAGVSYGYASGSFKGLVDIHKAIVKQMAAMGTYVGFCFFCGQFQGLFSWTNLGAMSAIAGADFLESIGFTGIPMCIGFIVLVTLVDIFFSSGSAKWAIFAPIFVPMFLLLDYHPGFTQIIYRLGDSAGNLFGPTSAYLWMLLSVAQAKYDKNLKIGQIISCNLMVAVILEVFWILLLVVWMLLDLPIGPGINVFMPAAM